jgi:polar amino acid transport system substrate-binding protein
MRKAIIAMFTVIVSVLVLVMGCSNPDKSVSVKPATTQAKMRFVTEDYPPITFQNKSGEITGLATDMVKEIMRRQGIDEKISIMPWQDAYNVALNEPNVVIFSIRRISERENLFNWVGPIGETRAMLYSKKDSGITLDNMDDAKRLDAIGVVDNWFSKQELEDYGFKNLVSSPMPTQEIEKLMRGEVQAVTLTNITAKKLVEETGYTMNDLEPNLLIDSGHFYIGLSKNTSEEKVKQWDKDLADIKRDGTFGKIYKKYFPNENIADLINK